MGQEQALVLEKGFDRRNLFSNDPETPPDGSDGFLCFRILAVAVTIAQTSVNVILNICNVLERLRGSRLVGPFL